MLTGFENITHELTQQEKELLPYFIKGLQTKIGAENAITNSTMRRKLKEIKGIEVPEARVRKIINYICMHELVPGLLANSKGYYVSTDIKEITDYEKSLVGRVNAITGRLNKVRQYKQQLLEQQ